MTFPVPNAYGKNQVPCKSTGSPSLFQHHRVGQEVFSECLTVPDPRAWCQKQPDTSTVSVVEDLHTSKLMGPSTEPGLHVKWSESLKSAFTLG